MSNPRLRVLAHDVLATSRAFVAFRQDVLNRHVAARDLSMNVAVGSAAASMLGVLALQPAITVGFDLVALAALGRAVHLKLSLNSLAKRLSDDNVATLTDAVHELPKL